MHLRRSEKNCRQELLLLPASDATSIRFRLPLSLLREPQSLEGELQRQLDQALIPVCIHTLNFPRQVRAIDLHWRRGIRRIDRRLRERNAGIRGIKHRRIEEVEDFGTELELESLIQ